MFEREQHIMALYTITTKEQVSYVKGTEQQAKSYVEKYSPLKRGWHGEWREVEVRGKKALFYFIFNNKGRSLKPLGYGALLSKGIPTGKQATDLSDSKPVKEVNGLVKYVGESVIVRFDDKETQIGVLTARADQKMFRVGKYGKDFSPRVVQYIGSSTTAAVEEVNGDDKPKAKKTAKAPKTSDNPVKVCNDSDTLDHIGEDGERMHCDECSKPIHYDWDVEEYRHCDGSSCWLIGPDKDEAKPVVKTKPVKRASKSTKVQDTKPGSTDLYTVPDELGGKPLGLVAAKNKVEVWCKSDFKRGWTGTWGGRGGLSYSVKNSRGETQYTVSIKKVQ